MNDKKGAAAKALDFLETRGFYIILFLCVVSIGIAGYVFFFRDTETEASPDVYMSEALPAEDPEETLEVPPMNQDYDDFIEPAMAGDEGEPEQDETLTPVQKTEEAKPETQKTEAVATMRPAEPESSKKPVRPVSGEVAADYSGDALVYSPTMDDWRVHTGTDFEAREGEQVVAILDGNVSSVWTDELLGRCVLLDCGDGIEILYTGLMDETAVSEGDSVSAGDVIGGAGSTSLLEASETARLHIEMSRDGELTDLMELFE